MKQSSAFMYTCQATACRKIFHGLRALVKHMYLQHSFDKRLGLTCGIDGCSHYFNVVSTYRGHVRTQHASHWDGDYCTNMTSNADIDMEECENETEVSDNVSHMPVSDQTIWNSFLNDFAEHLAFLRLKVTEAHSLPLSVVTSIFQDVQSMFDIFQEQFTDSVKNRLKHLGISWSDDILMQEMFSKSSVFERCSSSISTEHAFLNLLKNKFKLNLPVCQEVSSVSNLELPDNACHVNKEIDRDQVIDVDGCVTEAMISNSVNIVVTLR